VDVAELPADLVKAVARHEVLLVVGTGASMAAVSEPDSPVSWRGLLQHGLDYAGNQKLLSDAVLSNGSEMLREGEFDSVATLIGGALRGSRSDWLRSAFAQLELGRAGERLYDAIAAIGAASLITTNYDTLLDTYLKRTPISWTTPNFSSALGEPEVLPDAVLHLHGYFLEADSVVLDPADYERLTLSPAMSALQAASANRPLLFVGCGPDGLKDPHFSRLWSWLGDVSTRQHYALLPRSVDTKAMREVSGPHLRFLIYEDEDDHAGLPAALEKLAEEALAETDQLQGVGRVAVGALDKIVDEIPIVVVNAIRADAYVPEGFPISDALRRSWQDRLHWCISEQTRGRDLCVISNPVATEDVDGICRSSNTDILMPLEDGGMLLGSPGGARRVIDDSAVEVDFSSGPLEICEARSSGQTQRTLRVTYAKNRIANERTTLLIGEHAPSLVALPGVWPSEAQTAPRGKRLLELAPPDRTDSALSFNLAITEQGGVLVSRAVVREVVYGLSQERFAGLRRVLAGQAPVTAEAREEVSKLLDPLDESAFPLLRLDIAAVDTDPEANLRLNHLAAPVELRSAWEAAYEALTDEEGVPQTALHALVPWVRRAFRRPVDDGASLTAQAGEESRLLLAASLGDFNLARARTSFARQRTLIGLVADLKLRLAYTLRSRRAGTSNSPPERQFLIHCFSGGETASDIVARQSVAAAVQSTFHNAYPISYSSAIPGDLEDVQIAAGNAEGYAQRWLVPTTPSHVWPVSDLGFIADYIRTLPGDIAVTWECRGENDSVEPRPANAAEPYSLGGQDNPFDELKSLAFDPAYGSGNVGLRCCVAVRGTNGADAEVAEQAANLVGNEVFGASAFELLDSDKDEYASVSAGHALLAMHAPFGRLYATSYDTPRRLTRPLKDQNFSGGVAIGIGERKGVERDYGETVTLSDIERFHHVHIVGRPGVGKTTLLKRMIRGDLEAGNGVTVVDPHGGLADWTVAQMPTHRLKDVVLVDLDATSHVPTLNLLGTNADDYDRVVSEVIHFMRERSYHEWSGPVFEQLVRLGFLSMRDLAYPVAPALTDLVLLLANRPVREALRQRVKDEDLRDGWSLQGGQDPKHYAEVLQWVTSKFDELTKDPALRAILGAPFSTLNIADAVSRGKILIFRLTATRISEQAVDFIGSMLLTALQQELLNLSTSRDRPSHFVYIDEFHRFATLGLERLVVEARKYRVGITLAHQNLSQLSAFHQHTGRMTDQIPSTLVGNAGTLVVFPVSSYDHKRLAEELGAPVEELGRLARFQALVRIAVGTGSIEPFTIEVEDMGEPDVVEQMAELHQMMRTSGVWVPIARVVEDVGERHETIRKWALSRGSEDSVQKPVTSLAQSKDRSDSAFLSGWIEKREAYLEAHENPADSDPLTQKTEGEKTQPGPQGQEEPSD
jgi:hypothetical protein